MHIIVDGYNLIFQCGLQGKSTAPSSLERARKKLVRELASFSVRRVPKSCTVVFDAKTTPVKELENDFEIAGVRVLFATDFDEADTLIEQLIRKHSTPKQLTIVSSDHRLHKSAIARRAKPIDSDVWYENNIEKDQYHPAPSKPTNGSDSSGPQVTPADLKELTCAFQMSDDELESLIKNPGASDRNSPADELGIDVEPVAGGELDLEEFVDEMNPFPPGYGEDLLE